MELAGRRGRGVPCPLFLLLPLLAEVARGDFRDGPPEEQQGRVGRDQGDGDPVGQTDKLLRILHNRLAGEEKTATRWRQELRRASLVVNTLQNTSANLDEARGQINVLRVRLREISDLKHEANVKLEIERNRSADLDLRVRNVTSGAALSRTALMRLRNLTEHLVHENMVLNDTLQKELAERRILRLRVEDMHHNAQVEVESTHRVEVELQERDRALQRAKAELNKLRNVKAQGDQRLRDEQRQSKELAKQEQKGKRQNEEGFQKFADALWESTHKGKEIEKSSKGLENMLAVLKRELAESQAREREALKGMKEDNAVAETHEKAIKQKLAAREKELDEVHTQEEELHVSTSSRQEALLARIRDLQANTTRSISALRSTGKLVLDLRHQVNLLTTRNREVNSARDQANEDAKRVWAAVARAKVENKGLTGQLPALRSKAERLVQFAQSETEKAEAAYKDRDSTALLLDRANGDLARLKEQYVKALQVLAARKSPQGLKVKKKPTQGYRADEAAQEEWASDPT